MPLQKYVLRATIGGLLQYSVNGVRGARVQDAIRRHTIYPDLVQPVLHFPGAKASMDIVVNRET